MDRIINTALLGTAPDIASISSGSSFSFNGWSLDNGSSVRVIGSDHDDMGTIDFDTYNTPLQDGGGVLGKYYRRKTINIMLSISAGNKEGLNDLIDEIKYQTSKTEGLLNIKINNVVRQWTATCTSLKFNRESYNVNWIGKVKLTFTCVNPHSFVATPNSVNIISQSGTYQSAVDYGGRANSYPRLYMTVELGTTTGMTYTLNG